MKRRAASLILLGSALSLLAREWGARPATASASDAPTVAVLYFDYDGKDDNLVVLRKGLAQMLITDLAAVGGFRVVERARLQALLDEMRLNRSSRFDPKTATRIGKLLGVRYLVLGSYLDILGVLRINADVVEVESGWHASSAAAAGRPEEFLQLEQQLGTGLAKILAGLPRMAKSGVASPPRPRIAQPAQLKLPTALRYSKALDAVDRGDVAGAKGELQGVLKEQRDFALAEADLDHLLR